MLIGFELTGLTALLQHNDDVEASDTLDAWRKDTKNKGISKAGDDRSPAWTWQTYLYHDGKNVSIPSANLMVALRSAGAQMILKKQKTFKEISQSGMGILAEYLEFRCGENGRHVAIADVHALREETFAAQSEGARELDFRLFVKRAKIGQSKHVRVRPRFDQWSVRGELLVVAQELTFDAVSKLFELSGRVGLCDWRPGCKTPGPFGMFTSKLKRLD
jgi:hypothetical protein